MYRLTQLIQRTCRIFEVTHKLQPDAVFIFIQMHLSLSHSRLSDLHKLYEYNFKLNSFSKSSKRYKYSSMIWTGFKWFPKFPIPCGIGRSPALLSGCGWTRRGSVCGHQGFFRRSIQQKIQYRACLKNQQCSIVRVNRNRCQYCRSAWQHTLISGHTLISESPILCWWRLLPEHIEIYVYWLCYCVASCNRYLMLINLSTDGATRGLTLRVRLLGRYYNKFVKRTVR